MKAIIKSNRNYKNKYVSDGKNNKKKYLSNPPIIDNKKSSKIISSKFSKI